MGKNTNCLAGWKCPKCWNNARFKVEVHVVVELHDDGTHEDRHADTAWTESSWAMCPECGLMGTVATFTTPTKRGKHGG